jgi:hypothetical protein
MKDRLCPVRKVTCDAVTCLIGFITVLFTHVNRVKALLRAEGHLLPLGAAVCSESETSFVNLQLKEHATDLAHKFYT